MCLLLMSHQALADQWLLMKKSQAQKAEIVLSRYIGKSILFFCGCCSQDKGELMLLKNVSIKEYKSTYLQDKGELYQVHISYTDSKGIPDSGAIDLAYAWLQVKAKALNVAEACGFEYDACVTNKHFAWAGKKKPLLPKKKK